MLEFQNAEASRTMTLPWREESNEVMQEALQLAMTYLQYTGVAARVQCAVPLR
jgi:hypothetical protein